MTHLNALRGKVVTVKAEKGQGGVRGARVVNLIDNLLGVFERLFQLAIKAILLYCVILQLTC